MARTKRVQVLMEPKEHRRLERIARQRRVSVAELIRSALQGQDPAPQPYPTDHDDIAMVREQASSDGLWLDELLDRAPDGERLRGLLEERARRMKRSIEQEAVACLRDSLRSRRREVEEFLAVAKEIRESLDIWVTEEDLERYINEGRE